MKSLRTSRTLRDSESDRRRSRTEREPGIIVIMDDCEMNVPVCMYVTGKILYDRTWERVKLHASIYSDFRRHVNL